MHERFFLKRKKIRLGGKQQERHKEKFMENGSTLAEEKQIVYSAASLVLFQSNKIVRFYLTHSLVSILELPASPSFRAYSLHHLVIPAT